MSDTEPKKDAGQQLAETLEKVNSTVEGLESKVDTLSKEIEEKSKAQPFLGGHAPGFYMGESPNSSKPFSFGRLVKAQVAMSRGEDPGEVAKNEMDYCRRLGKVYDKQFCVPLSDVYIAEDGDNDLAKEWRDMQSAQRPLDYGEMQALYGAMAKDLTFRTSSTGGTMVSMPRQGELIELLRANSWTSQAGFREVPLPPNGSIRYPRVTSGVTISSYAESEASTESTPGTGELLMEAKGYTGLVEITEQFLKFADSVAGDAFVRQEMAMDTVLKYDRDIIDGPGGKSIQGLISYSGITTHTASTVGANGNTLDAEDLDLLVATMADADVPVELGVSLVMRNKLWAALKHRENTDGQTVFVAGTEAYGGGVPQPTFSGNRVIRTSQVPNTRVKGSGTDLTLVLAVIGREILMGRSGAMEIKMTDSHSSNFASGIVTLRGSVYLDCVPRHEESIGVVDQLLNS